MKFSITTSFQLCIKELLGDKIDTVKKNTETLIDASKQVGLEIKVGKN
jgi:hypothetical protein